MVEDPEGDNTITNTKDRVNLVDQVFKVIPTEVSITGDAVGDEAADAAVTITTHQITSLTTQVRRDMVITETIRVTMPAALMQGEQPGDEASPLH